MAINVTPTSAKIARAKLLIPIRANAINTTLIVMASTVFTKTSSSEIGFCANEAVAKTAKGAI